MPGRALLLCGFIATASSQPDCSRESSRKVRSYLDKSVFPRLQTSAGGAEALPQTCQLNPLLDMYRTQEKSKQEVSRGDWKCNLCGKHFRSEFYIDKHVHSHHADRIDPAATVCLADLCPIFGCDVPSLLSSSSSSSSSGSSSLSSSASSAHSRAAAQSSAARGVAKKAFQSSRCTQSEVEKSKYRCEVMTKRCFPQDAKQQQYFYDKICAKLHCEGGQLKGILKSADEPSGSFVFWLLRVLLVGMLLLFATCYVVFVGVKVMPQRDKVVPMGAASPSIRALKHTFDSLADLLSPAKRPPSKKRM